MATAIVSTPKPPKWFSPKYYFKSKSKSKSNLPHPPLTCTEQSFRDFDGESLSEDDKTDDLKMAFEEASSGFITPKGLQQMLSRLGDSRPRHDCVSMIKAFDLDGNGLLDFPEFLHMMTSH